MSGNDPRPGLLYQETPHHDRGAVPHAFVEVNGSCMRRYLPRDLRQPFLDYLKAGEDARLRVDKHFLYLKRADGKQAKFSSRAVLAHTRSRVPVNHGAPFTR